MSNTEQAARVEEYPLVSIVTPTYNQSAFLRETIESVLAQDYPHVHVVVCDDGSTDRTAEIAASYPGITLVRQPNKGRAAACNTAIRASDGQLLTSFDADDLWPATRVRRQVEYLLEHPEAAGVFGRQEWMNPPPWLGRDVVYGDLDGIPLSSAMFRREVLSALGGYDTAFTVGEDTDVLIRMRERGVDHVVLPDVVLYRRYHEGSITAGRNPHAQLIQSLRAKLERGRPA